MREVSQEDEPWLIIEVLLSRLSDDDISHFHILADHEQLIRGKSTFWKTVKNAEKDAMSNQRKYQKSLLDAYEQLPDKCPRGE